jgi:peptidoglycan-associated lipoprotein
MIQCLQIIHPAGFLMKKHLSFAIAVLILTPACGWRKNKSTIKEEELACQVSTGPKKQSIFAEDIDSFELREETNPFAGADEAGSMEFVDAQLRPDHAADQLKTIYFDFDEFDIRADQASALDYNIAKIKSLTAQGHTIVIEGHACSAAGSKQYNVMLSEKRARAIASYLIDHGVDKNMIKTVGRGNEMCIVFGGGREEQAPNRRVEFYLLKD